MRAKPGQARTWMSGTPIRTRSGRPAEQTLRQADQNAVRMTRGADLGDVNGRADGNPVVELDHVRDQHADAAVRRRGADRARRVGAVDPGAVEDPEPARLERVLGRAAGDHRAGQVPRPVGVRHAPRGVDRLVLDVVEARWRLQPDLADGDSVGLRGLEVLVERELEAGPVDEQDRRILLGQLIGGHLRLDDLDVGPHGLGVADVEQPPAHLAAQLARQQPAALLRLARRDVAALEVHGRVDRGLVDRLAHARHEAPDGAPGVCDVQVDLRVERLAAQRAPGPPEHVAVARALQGRVDGPVDVDGDRSLLGRERVALAACPHDDRTAQRLEHRAAQLRARALHGHLRDVDAADPHTLRDLLAVGAIVRVHGPRAGEEQKADHGGDESGTSTHFGDHDGKDPGGTGEPLQSAWRPAARPGRSNGSDPGRSRRCSEGMTAAGRTSPRDRLLGVGLQGRLVLGAAAVALACSGFFGYRAIAAIEDAYRWTGESEASALAHTFARSLSSRDLDDVERIRARGARLTGAHPDLAAAEVEPAAAGS